MRVAAMRTGKLMGRVLVGLALSCHAAPAQEFYAGKQVTLIVAGAAGGGYDQYARVVSRHMSRHIPGKPDFIVRNMLGAGGIAATNYLAEVAARDGTVLGLIPRETALTPLLQPQTPAIRFDAAQLNWIGTPLQDTGLLVVNSKSPAQTVEALRRHEVTVAGTGPGGGSSFFPRVLNAIFGTKFRVIEGYKGTTEAQLAVERGEVDGYMSGGSSASFRANIDAWAREGRAKVLLQLAFRKDPTYEAPLVFDLATDDRQRRILTLALSSLRLGRPFVAPPGIPAERLALLRRAFDATMRDRDFLADAAKMKLELAPLAGDALERLVRDVYALEPALVREVQAIAR
ncbi:MAG: hypothetical protein IT536_11745 [Hyphomicrobiales bacterium]|nr:hypothetical protein [Hyphomicrobiales bacterium]